MASLVVLPNETLDRIFSFLSDHKDDIKACRHVCRLFRDLSSPYLITRLVFARRVKTIAKLLEVVNHHYFHRHITELLYDASSYDEEKAASVEAYAEACLDAWQPSMDAKWVTGRAEDQEILRGIASLPLPGSLSSLKTRSGEEQPRFKQYSLGSYQSYLEYSRLCLLQKQIDDSDVRERVLSKALSSCWKLKDVVFADWRSLATLGDAERGECAGRLFGTTLAPDVISCASVSRQLIERLARIISHVDGAHIESFSVGSHMFEAETAPYIYVCPSHAPSYIMGSQIDAISEMVKTIRRLHLQLCVNSEHRFGLHDDAKDSLRMALQGGSSIEHLTLMFLMHKLHGCIGFDTREQLEEMASDSLLADLTFPCLKMLHLRWGIWRQPSLERFLARHASTLRIINFSNCYLLGDQTAFAEWAGEHLRLDGIEISVRADRGSLIRRKILGGDAIESEEKVGFLTPDHKATWLASK